MHSNHIIDNLWMETKRKCDCLRKESNYLVAFWKVHHVFCILIHFLFMISAFIDICILIFIFEKHFPHNKIKVWWVMLWKQLNPVNRVDNFDILCLFLKAALVFKICSNAFSIFIYMAKCFWSWFAFIRCQKSLQK